MKESVCENHNSLPYTLHKYFGPNCGDEFVQGLVDQCKLINEQDIRVPYSLTPDQQQAHDSLVACTYCHEPFEDNGLKIKVVHHCHLSGDFIATVCQKCNNKYRLKRNSLVIAMHNFSGYDFKHVVKALYSFFSKNPQYRYHFINREIHVFCTQIYY